MKKYLFAVILLLGGVFSACTDSEDIEIVNSGRGVSFEINTQSIYDEFGFTNSIKNLLRDNTYAVCVKSFIYDEKGYLADSVSTYTYNTNSIKQNYSSLKFGEYTAVFVETLVYSDNMLPWNYRIEGVENISTLEIKQIAAPYWHAVLGVTYQKFTVGSVNDEIHITPKALGSVVDCNFYNFKVSPCVNVAIGTEEICAGYRLDPSIPEENRYSSTLMKSDTFYSLGDTEVSDEVETFDIYVLGKSLTYTLYYQTTKNAGTTSWNYLQNYKTDKMNTGTISYLGYAFSNDDNGTVYHYFGNYAGLAQWYNGLSLGNGSTVGDLVPDIYMSWGSSVSNVQASMNSYSMTEGTSGRAILQEDGSYAISYKGKGKESKIMYLFTSATTGLFEVDVQYAKDAVTSSEILNYLNNNYIYLADEAGTYMFYDNAFTTYVLFFEINGVWNIGFVDMDYVLNMNAKAQIPSFKQPQRSIIGSRPNGEMVIDSANFAVNAPNKESKKVRLNRN